jgi:predicted TIM-barrel fold metal-dependent hydrolase
VRWVHRETTTISWRSAILGGDDPSTTSPASILERRAPATWRAWQCHRAGFLGVNISPFIWGIPANASVLYPLYAYCESNNLVAIVHGSLHYNRFQSMWLGDPQYMDEIAMNFPSLKLVISHAANGFGVLGLAVAQKHPNIFLEFSALWPKYLPDATIQAVNSYLKDRCLFGTDYPLVEFGAAVEAWSDAVKPEVGGCSSDRGAPFEPR